MIKKYFSFLILLNITWACQYKKHEEVTPVTTLCDTTFTVNYITHINPIMSKYCINCHSSKAAPSSGGNIILDNYKNVYRNAEQSYRAITGVVYSMPRNGPKMDTCDISTISRWIKTGKAE